MDNKSPGSFTSLPDKCFPCSTFPAGLSPSGKMMGERLNHLPFIKCVYLLLTGLRLQIYIPYFISLSLRIIS